MVNNYIYRGRTNKCWFGRCIYKNV